MIAPTLETERLIMRMWREDDFEEYAELCANPEVMRFLGGKTFDRTEAWRHMASLIGHWHLRGYGVWAVEEKAVAVWWDESGVFTPRAGPHLNLAGHLRKNFGERATPPKPRGARFNMLSVNWISHTSLV